ncbi:hypothetical protein FZC35_02025 [Candidatus Cytomitobacter indipagum]|uniref:Uncharacterized protein n=1 Tax=Candidatus Cytomitobacter indipagum TaxID=2601575 RepID=A0A5C0UFV5_9PROT|nr:hypothetical protein [Candidatus Cytomitobacter indipagum]QEK38142.1 hypothetical protein FZC35_02025 [Candidatus Cytomitobacter indipagum]
MYKFFRIPFIYLATFLNIYAGIIEYDFSIEDVGQGNCQIMKYVVELSTVSEFGDSHGKKQFKKEDGKVVESSEQKQFERKIERKTVAFLYDCGKVEFSKNLGTKLDEETYKLAEELNSKFKELNKQKFELKSNEDKMTKADNKGNSSKNDGTPTKDYARWSKNIKQNEEKIKEINKEIKKLSKNLFACKKIHQYFPILKEVNREKFDKLSDKDKKELLGKVCKYINDQNLVKEEQESDKTNQPYSINTMAHNLRAKLQNLDYLFVILSHPDKDHINFISKLFGCECAANANADDIDKHSDSKYLKDCKIMSILCGYWRKGDENSDEGKEDNSNVMKQALGCLKKRSHILIEPFITKQKNSHLPKFFSGDIESMFNKFVAKKSLISGFDAIIKELKDHIYIWSMNTPGNPNAQSPIISFTGKVDGESDEQAYSVICAGDAEDSTYSNMVTELAIREQKNIRSVLDLIESKFGDSRIALVAPHHGSEEQWQITFNLAKLFQANILYISNGHGGMYPHINPNFFKNLTAAFKVWPESSEKFFLGDCQISFESQYNARTINAINEGKEVDGENEGKKITVYKQKGKKGDKKDCPPWLFSTNDHGSLRIVRHSRS